jgi:hypothetical protein
MKGDSPVANKGLRACMKQCKTLLYEELLALVFIGLQLDSTPQ